MSRPSGSALTTGRTPVAASSWRRRRRPPPSKPLACATTAEPPSNVMSRQQRHRSDHNSRQQTYDPLVEAARQRVEASLRSKLTWAGWLKDAEAAASESFTKLQQVMTNANLLEMSRTALANDGHCDARAPDEVVAGLAFEQIYNARLTLLVQSKGDFWGGRHSIPAQQCKWDRVSKLVTAKHVESIERDGLVVIDDALSSSEVQAARAELAELHGRGELAEVEAQSRARIRNDKIGWIRQESTSGMPAIGIATRLLRAVPAEVERHASGRSNGPGAGAGYWRMAVPRLTMAAIYDGSPARATYYTKHFDGASNSASASGDNNPRRLTCIVYLNDAHWDTALHGGALRAYFPKGSAKHGSYVDVAPRAGRLLLFDSCTVEHEVRETFAPRMALTLWASKREA